MSKFEIFSQQIGDFQDWFVQFNPLYKEYLLNKNLEIELAKIIDYVKHNSVENKFRWHIEVGSIQFLAGVFPQENVIKLASKNLKYELTLLKIFETNPPVILKEYTQSIAMIPVENSPSEIDFVTNVFALTDFSDHKFKDVHAREKELSLKLVSELKNYKQTLFEKISDFALDLTANFVLIRVHLLKFLAILPCLDHDRGGNEVKRVFLEAIRRLIEDSQKARRKKLKGQNRALPKSYIVLAKIAEKFLSLIPAFLLAKMIRYSTGVMARRFIAGTDIKDAQKSMKELLESGRDATIDQLGELVVSKSESDHYCQKVLEIIEGIETSIEMGAQNASKINKAHVSIKVTALTHDFKPQDFKYTYNSIAPRLKKILLKAKEKDVFINIDAEHYHYRDCVFDIYKKVLLETEELHDFSQTGIVVQAYLKDAYKHFMEILELAKLRNIPMAIRLVKGAYWDAETIEAVAHNFESPQYLNKDETDIHFRQLIFKALEEHHFIKLAIASHNIKDHCFGEALREIMFPNANIIEHQCLHMTYEALSVGMSKLGWPTRNYIPVGDLLVGMAYLVRRIMENSSQVGVLTIMRSHNKSIDFTPPHESIKTLIEQKKYVLESSMAEVSKNFANIFPIRSYLKHHLKLVETELNNDLDKLHKGELLFENGEKEKVMSSNPEIIIGKYSEDQPSEVNNAIDNLFMHFKKNYSGYDNSKRLEQLATSAQIMLTQREKLTSLIMLEAGKTIDEACADVDEAIDFINFYVEQQLELEKNNACSPRGVIGVIAPWNFPLAIPCGMTVAALCAGNSVILKPAEQTPLIALQFIKILREAGISENELSIVIGEAAVGAAIVDHPKTNGIVFTGSKQVGELIYSKISHQISDSDYPFPVINKFAITEMGGKNAIIVTNNCELDETVSGIIYSAFAHAGQKCSAASRVIIDRKVKAAFLERFKAAVADLSVGKSTVFSTLINPLITQEDAQRVRMLAKKACDEVLKYGGEVIIDRSDENVPGFCVGPSVFELDKSVALSKNTVATEEVFGPIVHVIAYDNLDEAVELFNSTDYALTGGIYCQSQDDIDYLAPKLHAGNIYINRPNTGARVAIEPFGGFKMSGSGPKAGGIDYLSRFNQMKNRDLNRSNSLYDFADKTTDFHVQYSGLSLERRLYNTKRLLNQVINQFEVIFETISEGDKDKLNALKLAIKNDEFNLSQREYANRYVPGQLSFCKRDLPLGVGCFIDTTTNLNVQIVLDFFINLLVGNGLTIFCTNEKSFAAWKRIIDLAYLNGFSSFNLQIIKVSKDALEKSLLENEFHFVVLSNINNTSQYIQKLLQKKNNRFLVKVIYAGQNENWSQGIESFTHCRAFAINTMRHGAPLEISI